MATIDIKDAKGEKTGTAELNPSVFGIEPNVPVMHLAVRAQRASWRQGTHDTKTRGEVRGARRAPAALVRAPSAHLNGLAAAPCSVRTPAPTR